MTELFPKLCMDCKYSKPEERSTWNNRCFHPKVVADDSWALANNNEGKPYGVTCRDERHRRSWFAPCGMKGRLFERKLDATVMDYEAKEPKYVVGRNT